MSKYISKRKNTQNSKPSSQTPRPRPASLGSRDTGIMLIVWGIALLPVTMLLVPMTFLEGQFVKAHPFWYFLPIIMMFGSFGNIILSFVIGGRCLMEKDIKSGCYIAFWATIAAAVLGFGAALLSIPHI